MARVLPADKDAESIAHWRVLAVILAFLVVIVQALAIGQISSATDGRKFSLLFGSASALIAVIIATYLYCFRFPEDWERTVDQVKREEDKAVSTMTAAAKRTENDSAELKL